MSASFADLGVSRAWVTGASSGIGRAVALELAREGVEVAATARRSEELDALAAEARAAGGTVRASPGDVTDRDAVGAIVDRFQGERGAIDLAVLNAGLYIPVSAARFDLGAFRKTFDVNLNGVVNCLDAVLPSMTARRAGRIVIVASVAGYGGLPRSAAYGATKAALINLAESLKFDLDPLGITIQVANPGFVDTPATRQNDFEMPALTPVDVAGRRIVEGVRRGGFEITFPRRFTYVLKAMRLLPYPAYFGLVGRATGGRAKR